jgi:dUTP pyrophosphatase
MIDIQFKKLSENAVIPTKAHPTDAGFDMVATSRRITDDYIEYGTDIAIKLPEGYCAMLFPRSSNSLNDLVLANSVGIVDENYTGEIKWRFKRITKGFKLGLKKIRLFSFIYDIKIESAKLNIYEVGDRIGQIVIMPIPQVQFTEVDKLPKTDRGDGGFGSTGTKVEDLPVEKPTKRTRKKKAE